MNLFYGFDLGDAESAIAYIDRSDQKEPIILKVAGSGSFVTAYARTSDGRLLIGESACYDVNAIHRSVRFKRGFLLSQETDKEIRSFALGVLGDLEAQGLLNREADVSFYVGCPAGWGKNVRERYRKIFESCGYPPTKIVSESRAALISACHSKHFQVGYDIASKSVLVIDIGSSTTDFAFIHGGKEVELQTAGEVFLGGGIMDQILLEESVRRSENREKIEQVFRDIPAWKSYCDFAARRVKEQYFSDETFWQANECAKTIRISGKEIWPLTIRLDTELAEIMMNRPCSALEGRSFRTAFMDSLNEVRDKLSGVMPELIYLTGGVSKLPAIQTWCEQVFPEAVIISGNEPEFSVAKGLAWCGRIDEELREFRREVDELIESTTVEQIVEQQIEDLYRRTVDALVEPMLREVVLPVFEQWRDGTIRKLSDIDGVLSREIERWLRSDSAQQRLVRPVTEWLRPIGYAVEERTMPICIRHGVPYKALSLNSYLSLSDVDIQIHSKNVFAVEELTWLINAIVSILVGIVCGGSGIAIVSSGVGGIAIGTIVSLLILFIGKEKMQSLFMQMDVPAPFRKLVRRSHLESRVEKMSEQVKTTFYSNLENEQNADIVKSMAEDISKQIEKCLAQMAEVVEIPL